MKTYLALYLTAMLVTLLSTRLLINLAGRWGLVDLPGVRKVHPKAVPRIGGLAIFCGTLGPLLAVLLLNNTVGRAFREWQTGFLALLGCGAFICLVGLLDDIWRLSAWKKLIAQFAGALVLAALGVRVNSVFGIDWVWLSWAATILWIVGVTNAVNLIDGLDGLAAGVAAIACGVIAVFAHTTGQPVMITLMLALLGSLSGFLILNFNPARIFMGDSGSMFLGFMIAGSSVLCSTKKAATIGLIMPALALGVPLFDMGVAVLRRILERRGIMSADRGHLHHRLVAMGLTQRRAVLLLYGMTAMVAGLALFLMVLEDAGRIVVFGSVLVLLVVTFHMLGAFRLDDALAKLSRQRERARMNSALRVSFEAAELRLREAKTMDEWWQAICDAAEHLGFLRLDMHFAAADGPNRNLAWQRGGASVESKSRARFDVRLGRTKSGDPVSVALEAAVADSIEATGRSVTLFGRLLDSHGHVPTAKAEATSNGRAETPPAMK